MKASRPCFALVCQMKLLYRGQRLPLQRVVVDSMADEADHMADEWDAVVDYRGFARIMSETEHER